ncbi:hypothetical protein [Stenotrophomonas maltophilia]|jgi:hypothetical protein
MHLLIALGKVAVVFACVLGILEICSRVHRRRRGRSRRADREKLP